MTLLDQLTFSCKRLRHYLLAWNTRGEGIHSPYLFDLVRHALHDEGSFYCWERLRPNAVEKVVFRLLNYLHQQSGQPLDITIMQEDRYGRPKYRLAEIARAVDQKNIVNVEKGSHVRESLYVELDEKSVMVVTDIHIDHEAEEYWAGVMRRDDVTTTMDFFDVGFIFYDKHYLKKNYKMKL